MFPCNDAALSDVIQTHVEHCHWWTTQAAHEKKRRARWPFDDLNTKVDFAHAVLGQFVCAPFAFSCPSVQNMHPNLDGAPGRFVPGVACVRCSEPAFTSTWRTPPQGHVLRTEYQTGTKQAGAQRIVAQRPLSRLHVLCATKSSAKDFPLPELQIAHDSTSL